jgi:hypothetical protein
LTTRAKRRALFWSIFLPASLVAAILIWWFSMAGRIERLVWQMDSSDPETGAAAWIGLQQLYRSSWGAFEPTLEHVLDEDPIAFHIQRRPGPDFRGTRPPYHALSMPIGHEGRAVHCRTVGEAIMAMAYNEGRWQTDLRDDGWASWWTRNQGYYGYTYPDPEARR